MLASGDVGRICHWCQCFPMCHCYPCCRTAAAIPQPRCDSDQCSRRDFHRHSRCHLKFHARSIRCFQSIRSSFRSSRWTHSTRSFHSGFCSNPIPTEIHFLNASHFPSFRNRSCLLTLMIPMILSRSGCSCHSPYVLPPCPGALITQQHLCEALPSLSIKKASLTPFFVFLPGVTETYCRVFANGHNSRPTQLFDTNKLYGSQYIDRNEHSQ